jgi:hypothetical protein
MDAEELEQLRWEQDREEGRKDRLMRSASVILASIAVGFPDAEGVAIRRTLKLERLINAELALGH